MTNPHQRADIAHVLAQQVADVIERQLHDAIQALDNRAALADQLEDLVRWQRAEIERLKAENEELSARLAVKVVECACGCGRIGREAARGLVARCYMRLYRNAPERLHTLRSGRKRVRFLEEPTRVVAQRCCDSCGKPLDNLQGQFVMRGQGRTLEVCHECEPGLRQIGYVEVARAKRLDLQPDLPAGTKEDYQQVVDFLQEGL